MRDRTKLVSILGSCCRIAIVVIVLVFQEGLLCAQSQNPHQECEHLFTVAVRAEQQNDPIEAELRYEECRELAQKYRLPQTEAAALHRLAVIRARNKKFTESANLFRRAIELDPRNAMVLCDFAQLYANRKDYNEAEIILKKALDIDSNNPKVLFNLGSVIASQRGERQTEGLRYLKLAVGETDAYRELARIYHSKGDISRAEFAEQRVKEKLAEPPSATSYALTSERVPIRAAQPPAQKPQTPPEVVDRVRQELVDAETSKTIADAQRKIIAETTVQKPVRPEQASPGNPEKTTVMQKTVANNVVKEIIPVTAKPESHPAAPATLVQQQTPSSLPVDPFAAVHPLDPPSIPFEQTALVVQTSPGQSELQPQPVVQSSKPDEINKQDVNNPLVRIGGNKLPGNSVAEPQLTKISLPVNAEAKPLQRLPVIAGVEKEKSVRPTQESPKSGKYTARSENSNPLRQIPPGGLGLVDTSTESATMTVLPTYSAVGVKKIPGITNVEPQSLALTQPNDVVRNLEPVQIADKPGANQIPTQKNDVSVLQSPSAVIAGRNLQIPRTSSSDIVSGKENHTLNPPSNDLQKPTLAKQESSLGQKPPEYARIIRSGQRFNSKSSPAVLKFGTVRNDPPAEVRTEKLAEIASTTPIDESTARPLVIVKSSSAGQAEQSDRMKPVDVAPADVDPFLMAADTPLPISGSAELQKIEALTQAPSIQQPLAGDSMAKSVEVKRIEPQAPALPAIAAASPVLLPEAENTITNPRFAEVRKIEPQVPALPAIAPAATPDPFFAQDDAPAMPKFAEVKKPEPLPIAELPADLPKFAETRTLPIQQPLLVKESVISPLPPPDTSAGFASTRRTVKKAALDDQSVGFARSRR